MSGNYIYSTFTSVALFLYYNESYLNFMGCRRLSELSRFKADEGKTIVAQTLGKEHLISLTKKGSEIWTHATSWITCCNHRNSNLCYRHVDIVIIVNKWFSCLLQVKADAGTNTTVTKLQQQQLVGREKRGHTVLLFLSALCYVSTYVGRVYIVAWSLQWRLSGMSTQVKKSHITDIVLLLLLQSHFSLIIKKWYKNNKATPTQNL